MRNMFKKPHNIMLYKERTEFQEFGHAKKNFRLCYSCHAVYFNKSWHHLSALKSTAMKKSETLNLALCPACHMIADRQHEGVLNIEDIPQKLQHELMNLILSYTAKAYEKDCQHRLIAVNRKSKNSWVATTTENQLANKLAHKIKQVFDKVEVKTAYSTEPNDIERVTVKFTS